MRILTWNIAALPSRINLYRDPNKVIYNIIDKIIELNPNIICLQEVFDYNIQKIICNSLKYTNYYSHISYNDKNNFISKNGLLTASNYNIIDSDELDYSNFTGPEYLIKKGLLTTKLDYNNTDLYIHNTHLQSNSLAYYTSICEQNRRKQHREIINKLIKYEEDFNILCGDINDDYNTSQITNFFNNLPFKDTIYNNEKIVTFNKNNEQLDYIVLNKKYGKVNYDIYDTSLNKLSDHNILICDIDM